MRITASHNLGGLVSLRAPWEGKMMGGASLVEAQLAKTLETIFKDYHGPSFSIRLWDGWRWNSQTTRNEPSCTIVLRTPQALKTLVFRPSEVTLGEAFLSKNIDIEGDVFSAFAAAEHVFHCHKGQQRQMIEVVLGLLHSIGDLWKTGSVHSADRDRTAISYHYDQPIDFYRLWLGESLAYSCAYFSSETDGLDAAQARKLDMICRKLRLQPCDHFLDIGCGWGSLILHVASRYNACAHGITLSREQAAVAEGRIEKAQQIQSCTVELLDYREAPAHLQAFNKIASVGMFEHVGLKNLSLYFRSVYSMLTPGGVFLNHGIARLDCSNQENRSILDKTLVSFLRDILQLRQPRDSSFIDKYVFPDGELVTLSQALRAAESAGFEVRDVENLREHYELTLRCWVEALQRNADEILTHVSELTYRIWLLYMAGCAAAFDRGDIGIYQILLSRPDRGASHLPLTREDWYSVGRSG